MFLKRYWELYIGYFSINIRTVMVYDMDFIFGILTMVIKHLINFLFIVFLFNNLENINGYSFNQILFFYAFSTTSFALWHCFFINTISLSYFLRTGLFDGILLKPVNPIFQIMNDSFDEDGWGELLFGFVLLVISIIKLNIYNYQLIFLPVLLISSCLVYASISLLGSIFSFFTLSNTNLSNIAIELQEFAKYPLDIYGKLVQIVLTFLIPLGFASYFPSLFYVTSNSENLIYIFISPIFCVSFFVFSCIIWNYSIRFYKSSGH